MTLDPAATSLVAVCTRDRPIELARCLEALLRQTAPTRILVVDSASTNPDVRGIAWRFGVEYRRVDRPGLSAARNAALADDRAAVVLFVDDDAVPGRDWAERLLAELDDPAVAMVTGRILPLAAEPLLENSYSPLPTANMEARRIFALTSADWADATLAGLPGGGANLGIRRSSIPGWPGFDERFGRGSTIPVGDENMAFFDIVRRGGTIVYAPDAVVRHPVVTDLAQRLAGAASARRAYVAFWLAMLVEVRDARGPALRRLFGLTAKTGAGSPAPVLSRWQSALAALGGIGLYIRHRRH